MYSSSEDCGSYWIKSCIPSRHLLKRSITWCNCRDDRGQCATKSKQISLRETKGIVYVAI